MASRIARKRCVLLLGKGGAGKSTVANHLVGHDPLSPDKPPFRVQNKVLGSMTKEIKHETVEFMWENDLYRVTVIDTPGLFDTTAKETFEECDTTLYCRGKGAVFLHYGKIP